MSQNRVDGYWNTYRPFPNKANQSWVSVKNLCDNIPGGCLDEVWEYSPDLDDVLPLSKDTLVARISNNQLYIDYRNPIIFIFKYSYGIEYHWFKTSSGKIDINYDTLPNQDERFFIWWESGEHISIIDWSIKYTMPSYYTNIIYSSEVAIIPGSFTLPPLIPIDKPTYVSYLASEVKTQLQAASVMVDNPEKSVITIRKTPPFLSQILYSAEILQDMEIMFSDPIISGTLILFDKEFVILNCKCRITKMIMNNINTESVKIHLKYKTTKEADTIENYRYTITDRYDLIGENKQNEVGDSEQIDDLEIGTHNVISNFLIRNKNFDMLTWSCNTVNLKEGNFIYNYANTYPDTSGKDLYMWKGMPKILAPNLLHQTPLFDSNNNNVLVSWDRSSQNLTINGQTITISSQDHCFPILFWQRRPILFDAEVTQSYNLNTIESKSIIDFCQGDGYEDSEARIKLKAHTKNDVAKIQCFALDEDSPSFNNIALSNISSVLTSTNKFDYLKKQENAGSSPLVGTNILYDWATSGEKVSLRHNDTNFAVSFDSSFNYERLWFEPHLELKTRTPHSRNLKIQKEETWVPAYKSVEGWNKFLTIFFPNLPGVVKNTYSSWSSNFYDYSSKVEGPTSKDLHNIMLNEVSITSYITWYLNIWDNPQIKDGTLHSFPARFFKANESFIGSRGTYGQYFYFDDLFSSVIPLELTDSNRYSLKHYDSNASGFLNGRVPFLEFTPSFLLLEREDSCQTNVTELKDMHSSGSPTNYETFFNTVKNIVTDNHQGYCYITVFPLGAKWANIFLKEN